MAAERCWGDDFLSVVGMRSAAHEVLSGHILERLASYLPRQDRAMANPTAVTRARGSIELHIERLFDALREHESLIARQEAEADDAFWGLAVLTALSVLETRARRAA